VILQIISLKLLRNILIIKTVSNMTVRMRFPAILFLGGIFLFSLTRCSKKDEDPAVSDPTIPVLTTATIADTGQNTATCGGTVTSDGGSPVTSRGVCWSDHPGPEITGLHTVDGTGTGTYSSQLTGLTPNTLYHVRAYASNSKGTAYGNVQSFRTLKMVIDSVADIDGNIYHVVPIGGQSWLRENLSVTRYRNGEAIPNVTLDDQWKVLTTGAYCSFGNLPVNAAIYGNLYNWHALGDSRGLCPAGWHVPSDAEWSELGDSLGGKNIAGGMLKSAGTLEQGTGIWYAPNTGATNSSGFTGLPGGYRINYGLFYGIGNVGFFWSSSDTAGVNAWNYILDANNGELKHYFNFKTNGFSVRCCKD
jgi:uncharacterized protein (TIGR02145 family)